MADQSKEPIEEPERLSSDIVAFCALLARIMIRCLREKNPRVMGLLSLPSHSEDGETGGTDGAA